MNLAWMNDAACADRAGLFEESDTRWLHFAGERSDPNHARIALAKAVCLSCPVLNDCRAYIDRTERTTAVSMMGHLSGMVTAGETTRERISRRRRERRRAAWSV